MSKIGNLFKKFGKKKKNSQDLDEIFSDEFEDTPELDESDLDENDIAQFSEGDDLDIPNFDDTDIPKEEIVLPEKEVLSEETRAEFSQELTQDTPTPDTSNDTKEIDISGLQLEATPGELAAEMAQEEDDEVLDEFTDIVTNPQSKIDSQDEGTIANIQSQLQAEDENQDDDDYDGDDDYEDDDDEDDYYNRDPDFDYTMDTGRNLQHEIDLENDKITLKDRLEHLWTRFIDRFRNMNKKDLNVAMRPPGKESTLSKINITGIDKAVKKVKKVEWNSLVDRILKSKERPKIHRYYQYFLTFLFVYIFSNTIGNLLFSTKPDYTGGIKAPVVIDEDKMVTQTQINEIRSAKLFKTSQPEIAKQPEQKKIDVFTKCTKATKQSNLPIKLFHTVVLQDSVKSIASVSVRSSSKPATFREGDKISSIANLDRIQRMQLIVKNLSNGDCEYIPSSLKTKSSKRPPRLGVLTPKASRQYKTELKKIDGIENDGNNFKIKKEFLKEKMTDLKSLLQQAKGIPITNPDGSLSFKIVQVQPDSVYSYLGIQNGDIITAINGEPIENINAVTSLFAKISKIEKLNLTLTRDGESTTQNYNIK